MEINNVMQNVEVIVPQQLHEFGYRAVYWKLVSPIDHYTHVCMLCYQNEKSSLKTVHIGRGKGSTGGNPSRHFNKVHAENIPPGGIANWKSFTSVIAILVKP